MKKIGLLIIAVLCLSACMNNTDVTETTTSVTEIVIEEETAAADFLYDVYPGFVTIKKYIGNDKSVIVPSEIEGKPVERITPAFLSEANVSELTFLEGIKDIPHLTGCNSLKIINLPSTTLKTGTFQFYPALTEINIAENDRFKTVDGVLYSADMSTLIAFPQGREGSFKIPDGVKIIGDFAFHNAMLSEITFSDSLETIEAYAFRECKSITELNLPESLTSIGHSAFKDSALSSVTLPEGIKIIKSRAFEGTQLSELYLPESVTECGMYVADENVKISASYPTEAFSLIADEKNVTFRDETSLERAIRKLGSAQRSRIFVDISGDNFPEMAIVSPYGNINLYYFDFNHNEWSYIYMEKYNYRGTEISEYHNKLHLIYSEEYGDYVYCTDIYEVTMYNYDEKINDVVTENVPYQDIVTMKDGVFAVDCYNPQFIDLSKAEIIKTIDFEKMLENYTTDRYEYFELIMSAFADEPNDEIDSGKPFEWRGEEINEFPYFEKHYDKDVSLTVLGKDILRGEKVEGVSYDNGVLYLDNAFISADSNYDYIIGCNGIIPLTIDVTGECYLIGKSIRKFFETNGSPVIIKGDGTLYTTRMEADTLTISEDVKLKEYELEKYYDDTYDYNFVRNIDSSYNIESFIIRDNASVECLKIGGVSLDITDNSAVICEKINVEGNITVDKNGRLNVGYAEKLGLICCTHLKISDYAEADIKASSHEALFPSTNKWYYYINNLSVTVSGNGRLSIIGKEKKTTVNAAFESRKYSALTLNDNASVSIKNGITCAVFNAVIINGGALEIEADKNGQAVKIPCKNLINSNDGYFYLEADETGFIINGDIKKIELDDIVKTSLTDEEKDELKYNCEEYRRIYVQAENSALQ